MLDFPFFMSGSPTLYSLGLYCCLFPACVFLVNRLESMTNDGFIVASIKNQQSNYYVLLCELSSLLRLVPTIYFLGLYLNYGVMENLLRSCILLLKITLWRRWCVVKCDFTQAHVPVLQNAYAYKIYLLLFQVPFLHSESTYKIKIHTFNKTLTQEEKVKRIDVSEIS